MTNPITPEQWQAVNADDVTATALSIGSQGRTKSTRFFDLTNTTTILATEYPEIRWIVPGYIPEGFVVLAGRQKLGKTWLAMDFSIAVATGGSAMGSIACEQGDVLYIDMENGHRRIKKRIFTLFPHAQPDLSRLHWATKTISLKDGFIDALEAWRMAAVDPRLIVIDVLTRIKPTGSQARNAYENDYAAYVELQKWAIDNCVAVLALHHTRKGGADDPLESLSGSNGLSAVADTTLVLDRDSNGITLYGRGRDVPETDTALSFDGGLWTIKGDASEVHRSTSRSAILSALRDATEPMKPIEISDATGLKSGNVRKLLLAMCRSGEVQKSRRGEYVHPENEALVAEIAERSNPGNDGNNSNKTWNSANR